MTFNNVIHFSLSIIFLLTSYKITFLYWLKCILYSFEAVTTNCIYWNNFKIEYIKTTSIKKKGIVTHYTHQVPQVSTNVCNHSKIRYLIIVLAERAPKLYEKWKDDFPFYLYSIIIEWCWGQKLLNSKLLRIFFIVLIVGKSKLFSQ